MHLVTLMEVLASSIKLKLDSVLYQTWIYLFSQHLNILLSPIYPVLFTLSQFIDHPHPVSIS